MRNNTNTELSLKEMQNIVLAYTTDEKATITSRTAEEIITNGVKNDFKYADGNHHEIGYDKCLETQLSRYHNGKKLLEKFIPVRLKGIYIISNR